ncbi:MAG: extracellular solute-binding protein [Natronomonas sp.]|uniref:ABC transporter substrate-binding protein n=1 Tax=Natronomonas sp. TaxID=2184060 RepID=UPI00286FBC4C|nr:extracellular solute-binding protein [Natronomonas sp.]MDR9430650.1 extracellular solute-binding protein [Natronomonas sp.]
MVNHTTAEEEKRLKMQRRRVLAAAGAMGVTALAGCSSGDDGGSSGDDGGDSGDDGGSKDLNLLTTYTSEASKRSYNAASDEFNQNYPNVNVQMGYTDWENIYSRLVQAANTGEWPEMAFFMDNELSLILYDQGFADDPQKVIDPVTEVAGEIADDVPETHYLNKDGSFYCIQTNNQTPVSWYRTDVLEDIGMDSMPSYWDEELEYVKAAHEADNGLYGTSLSTARNVYMSDMFLVRLRSAGGNALDPENNVALDSQVTRDVLEHYNELTEYAAPGVESFSYGEAYVNYATDNVAHCLYWGRTTINVVDRTPEIVEYVVNAHPAKPDNDLADPNDNLSVMSGDGGQLIQEAVNKQEAIDWFQTYLQPDIFVNEYMIGTPGNTTPIYEDHQELWDNFDFWSEVEHGEEIRDLMVESARSSHPKCRAGPEFPAFPEMAEIVRTPVMSGPASEYYAGNISVDEAATEMAERAEQAVSSYAEN